ncbi:PREDICTED: spermatogenic leucine zipper protein 1 [Chrysochloris asiatica]|uniref:Spermatogenic leucine zipper protein 1 n=1 Tax=Chrysochloris asiatica TaxID=185453 RepID=A0A9B0U2W8_CHRAS|nr:PREDICTED: spermatogenic leucine zipper protein 1 [Chrysochloris asiatica]
MEAPTLPETFRYTPALHQESWDPTMIIALFEIGSVSLFFWSSLLPLKRNSNQVSEQLMTQKLENVLNRIEGILKNMTSFRKTTDGEESLGDINASDDVLDLKEKIRALDKINKTLFKNLLASLEPEKFQNEKKILENQNSEDTAQGFTRDFANHSDGKEVINETKISKEKAKYGLLHDQEENIKLRNNMEQLLQKAEHWSEQHTELSELIKSYQKSQHDKRELKNDGVHFQIQPHNKLSTNQEMEEQVRKLEHDTYSLHLTAALLENECQILQQRMEILNELHHKKERDQIDYEQGKKDQKLQEAEKVGIHRQRMRDMEGAFQKIEKFYIRLDVCSNTKARNNRFNTCIAKRGLTGKKRSASRSR